MRYFRIARLIQVLAVVVIMRPVAVLAADSPPIKLKRTIVLTPAALAFGPVAMTESKSMDATLENRTNFLVTFTAAIAGPDASAFSYITTCPDNKLGRYGKCTFSVTFESGESSAARAARLVVGTDDPNTPTLTLTLRGNNPYTGLNDTGITACSNVTKNDLPCPVAEYPEQDADIGRDKDQSDDANGHAGFNFTRLDAEGKEALPGAEWTCVRDNVTGLIWEVKPLPDGIPANQGLHDADDTYAWYSTDGRGNGGAEGQAGRQPTCYGFKHGIPNSATWCNTEAYVQRVNQDNDGEGSCGFKDWRVPTVGELQSLLDLSVPAPGPTLDMDYFPDVQAAPYWSSTPDAENTRYAWSVNFSTSDTFRTKRLGKDPARLGVRLVRGER